MRLSSYVWSGFLFIGLLAYASCSFTGIKGNGNVVKVEKNIKPFTELELDGVFDVILTQGETEKLEIEADENLIDLVTIKNVGNKLIVGFKKGTNLRKSTKFNVYITLKDITSLTMEGVGDIKNMGRLNLKTLEINKTGVGDLNLNISSSILDINSSGVGDVNLTGSSSHLIIDNSGVGDVIADTFKADDVKLDNNGVGDAKVFASEKINITNSGVGDVEFYGSPKEKHINKGGVGKVYQR